MIDRAWVSSGRERERHSDGATYRIIVVKVDGQWMGEGGVLARRG